MSTKTSDEFEGTDKELIVHPCDGCNETVMATATRDRNGLLVPTEPFAFILHQSEEHDPRPPLRPHERFVCKKCLRKRGAITPAD